MPWMDREEFEDRYGRVEAEGILPEELGYRSKRQSDPKPLNTGCSECGGIGYIEFSRNGDPDDLFWGLCKCNPESDEFVAPDED